MFEVEEFGVNITNGKYLVWAAPVDESNVNWNREGGWYEVELETWEEVLRHIAATFIVKDMDR